MPFDYDDGDRAQQGAQSDSARRDAGVPPQRPGQQSPGAAPGPQPGAQPGQHSEGGWNAAPPPGPDQRPSEAQR